MRDLDDLIKRLDRVENHMAEEIAPEVKKLFQESVLNALMKFYDDYEPRVYERTYNFLDGVSASTKVSGKGNLLTMTADSGSMRGYPGKIGQTLQPSSAFDMFFKGGMHGHGWLLASESRPPELYVDDDVKNQFGGKIDRIMDKTIRKIMK